MIRQADLVISPEATIDPWEQQARALLLVAEELNGAGEPEQILLHVVAVAARLLAVERVAIATNEGDHALRRYTWDDDGWRPASVRLPLRRSISGWVIRHGASYRSDDLAADGVVEGRPRFKTLLAVPILARDGRVLGALNLHDRRDGRPFSDDDQRLAEGIAHHAAVALERAMMLTDIRAHVSALEAKTKEQEAFLHTVSHALKNPLASILAMAELLTEEPEPQSATTRHGLDVIVRNAERLHHIVNDLLTLARADVRLQNLEPEPVRLDAVLETVRCELAGQLKARDVRLTIERPLPRVLGHAGRLTEVFTNLVDNAIKYTPPDRRPEITVGARVTGGTVECWVADNGIGVAPSQREAVFELFRRLGEATDLGTDGSGVGLSVAKRIVERYGGRIWFEEAPDGGASVHLTLIEAPVARVAHTH